MGVTECNVKTQVCGCSTYTGVWLYVASTQVWMCVSVSDLDVCTVVWVSVGDI